MDGTRDWRVKQVKRIAKPVSAGDVARGVPTMRTRPSRWQLIVDWTAFFFMVTCSVTFLLAVCLWAAGVI